jgi:DNA-directed RNA polymerase subunit L
MKYEVLKEEDKKLVLKLYTDTHTYPQILKEYCLKNGAEFVGYYKEHPTSKFVLFMIEGENPREIINKAKEEIVKDFKKLKEEIEKMEIDEK